MPADARRVGGRTEGKLTAAAEWAHSHRAYAGRRLREAHRGIDLDTPRPRRAECPACRGEIGRACEICEGTGCVAAVEASERPGPLPAAIAAACGEFLQAYFAIEKHGVEGWLALTPGGGRDVELDDVFVEALGWFDSELNRLEQDEDVARAIVESKDRSRREK